MAAHHPHAGAVGTLTSALQLGFIYTRGLGGALGLLIGALAPVGLRPAG